MYDVIVREALARINSGGVECYCIILDFFVTIVHFNNDSTESTSNKNKVRCDIESRLSPRLQSSRHP